MTASREAPDTELLDRVGRADLLNGCYGFVLWRWVDGCRHVVGDGIIENPNMVTTFIEPGLCLKALIVQGNALVAAAWSYENAIAVRIGGGIVGKV